MRTCTTMLSEVKPHYRAAMEYVVDTSIAVDGGAHKGYWTREMLKDFDIVWAFEPHHSHFIELPDDATNICGALGEDQEKAGLHAGPENDGQFFLDGSGETAVYPLDIFALPSCGFLKLDVEGYEYFALKGAEETIQKHRPVILIEENGLCQRYGVKPGDADDLIKGWRYRMVRQLNKDFIYAPRERADSPSRN